MVEQRLETVPRAPVLHEMYPGGDGLHLTALLRGTPCIRFTSAELTDATNAADIHLNNVFQEVKDPHAFPRDIVFCGSISQKNAVPTLSVDVPRKMLSLSCFAADEQIPQLLDRFFTLLDWNEGKDPEQLSRILPAMHKMQIIEDGNTFDEFTEIVQRRYSPETFSELLALSRKIELVDTTSEHDRNRLLFGITGIEIEYNGTTTMHVKGADGIIEVPMLPSTIRFYSQAESILRRELLRMKITALPSGESVLWYEKGIEPGSFSLQGKGGKTVFLYEANHQMHVASSDDIDSGTQTEAADTIRTLFDRLTKTYAELYPKSSVSSDVKGTEMTSVVHPTDPFLVPRVSSGGQM